MAPDPRPSTGHEAPLGLQLAHGQVLEDALLHVRQPVVVLVEDARRPRRRRAGPRTRSPQGSSRTVSSQVRIQPCSGLCSLVRSSWSISRSTALRHVLGQVALGQLGPVVVGVVLVPRPAELTQLLADGLELAAQEELALGLLHALFDVGLDPLAQAPGRPACRGPSRGRAAGGPRRRGSRAPRPSGSSVRSGE